MPRLADRSAWWPGCCGLPVLGCLPAPESSTALPRGGWPCMLPPLTGSAGQPMPASRNPSPTSPSSCPEPARFTLALYSLSLFLTKLMSFCDRRQPMSTKALASKKASTSHSVNGRLTTKVIVQGDVRLNGRGWGSLSQGGPKAQRRLSWKKRAKEWPCKTCELMPTKAHETKKKPCKTCGSVPVKGRRNGLGRPR